MAETVGIALAIAPLVISASKQYVKAYKCVQRYRRYEEGMQDLSDRVRIQRGIFRKKFERLLVYELGLGKDKAVEMLKDAEHRLWKDEDTEIYFTQRLGDTSEELVKLIQSIKLRLAFLRVEDESDPTMGNENPSKFISGETNITSKLSFTLSRAKIEKTVDEIRQMTRDFCTLIDLTAPPQPRSEVIVSSQSTQSKIARFTAVRTAADNLYEALTHACTKHSEHQAHLSLRPECGRPSQISFQLQFRQRTLVLPESGGPTSNENLPMWLTIESTVTGTVESGADDQLLSEMKSVFKRQRESESIPEPVRNHNKLVKKTVRFQTLAPTSQPRASPPPAKNDVAIENLCTSSNFCNQLQRLIRQPVLNSQTCVGYLERSARSKHIVYVNSKAQTITTNALSTYLRPLCDAYSSVRGVRSTWISMPKYRCISLAKQLATAVLQFHGTEWLRTALYSSDVLLRDITDYTLADPSQSHEPYVNVPIRGQHHGIVTSANSLSRTLIRNRLLFSLGVILVELACQASMRSLRSPKDVDLHEDQNTDYHTAIRLCYRVETLISPRYAKVARRCIKCDFGYDEDLNDVKLQEAVYQGVVCELEDLEDLLRRQGFSIP